MNKEFVNYNLALKLKELGFDEPCFAFYQKEFTIDIPTMVDDDNEYRLSGFRTCKNSEIPAHYTSAPLYQQVVEWLRQKGIIIELIVDGWGDDNCVNEENLCYRIFIWQIGKPKPHHNDDLGALATPQEAYSDAFDYIFHPLNNLI